MQIRIICSTKLFLLIINFFKKKYILVIECIKKLIYF